MRQDRKFRCYVVGSLFQLQNDWTGHRVSDTKAEIFKSVAERIESRYHFGPGSLQIRHICPFANDAVGTLTGLEHIDFLQAVPIDPAERVRVEPEPEIPTTIGVTISHPAQ
jgi:hypothetical protein